MSKARKLIEAIETGDYPDWFDPGKRRKIEQREDPYTKHQAMAHSSELASEGYQEVMRKIARYTGQDLRRMRGPMELSMLMYQALQQVSQIEEGKEEELEQLAVEIVLNLDEFGAAKEAVENGELRIIAELTQEIDLEGAYLDAEDTSDREEMQIAQVAQELDLETAKRRFLNMLTQGNAMQKSYVFHLAQDKLDSIHPRLANLYGVLMSIGELGQYIFSDEMQQQMMGSGQGAGGAARIKVGEDGVPEIHAQAITFPVLTQEIVKGLMEYMSYAEEDDPETRAFVAGQADTLSNEPMAQILGPGAWRRIVNMIPADKQKFIPYVYDHIARMSPGQFGEFMEEIQSGSARARQALEELIRDIESDDDLGESMAFRIVKKKLQ